MTKTVIEKMAKEIREWMRKNELYTDCRIYFNGKAFGGDSHGNDADLEAADPNDYVEYVGNVMTMTFEGGLYDVMNDWSKYATKKQDEFNRILGKYECYYELGYSWSLGVYTDETNLVKRYEKKGRAAGNKKVDDLSKAFSKALAAAEVYANIPDDGTCNFDSAVLWAKGWREADVKAAAEKVGLRVSKWGAGQFHILGYQSGQAERRSQMAEAFSEELRANGYISTVYYAMD